MHLFRALWRAYGSQSTHPPSAFSFIDSTGQRNILEHLQELPTADSICGVTRPLVKLRETVSTGNGYDKEVTALAFEGKDVVYPVRFHFDPHKPDPLAAFGAP